MSVPTPQNAPRCLETHAEHSPPPIVGRFLALTGTLRLGIELAEQIRLSSPAEILPITATVAAAEVQVHLRRALAIAEFAVRCMTDSAGGGQ